MVDGYEAVRGWIYENRSWVKRAVLCLSRRQREWNKVYRAQHHQLSPLFQLCGQCRIRRVRPPNWYKSDEDRFRRRKRFRSRAKKSWPREANLVWFVRQPSTQSHEKAEEWSLLLDRSRTKEVIGPPDSRGVHNIWAKDPLSPFVSAQWFFGVDIWSLLPRPDRVADWIAFCRHYAPTTLLVDVLFAANLFAPHKVKPLVCLIIEYCSGVGDDSDTPLFQRVFTYEPPDVGYRLLRDALACAPAPATKAPPHPLVEIATAPGI